MKGPRSIRSRNFGYRSSQVERDLLASAPRLQILMRVHYHKTISLDRAKKVCLGLVFPEEEEHNCYNVILQEMEAKLLKQSHV